MKVFIRVALPLAIIVAGLMAWGVLKKEVEPEIAQRTPRKAPTVSVRPLVAQDFVVKIKTQGVVAAHDETSLTARVAGRIKTIYPSFETGSFFTRGEVLLELDTEDYEAAVFSAKARLARAKADLAQEMARGEQARLNWKDLGYKTQPTDLVLRKPQLAQTKAELAAAEAAMQKANRDLKLCKVVAPYNGRVGLRQVSIGQSVREQTPLGDIFSTDMAELRLPLDNRQLGFVTLPERQSDTPLEVSLTDANTDRPDLWKAKITRTEGKLDENSRQLFVIAEIHDPFGLKSNNKPLRIGQPVKASITGSKLSDVFVIEREHLRSSQEIILIRKQPDPRKKAGEVHRIDRVTIDPIWSDETFIVLRDPLQENDQLAVGPISYSVQGGRVTPEIESVKPKFEEKPPLSAEKSQKKARKGI